MSAVMLFLDYLILKTKHLLKILQFLQRLFKFHYINRKLPITLQIVQTHILRDILNNFPHQQHIVRFNR